MDTKLKNRHRVLNLFMIFSGILLSVGACFFYRPIGYHVEKAVSDLEAQYQEEAQDAEEEPLKNSYWEWGIDDEMPRILLQNSYLFYVDFEKMKSAKVLSAEDILLPELKSRTQEDEYNEEPDVTDNMRLLDAFRDMYSNWENEFFNMESYWDYRAVDLDTWRTITNIADERILDWVNQKETSGAVFDNTYYECWFILHYDQYGEIKITTASNINYDELYRKLQSWRYKNFLEDYRYSDGSYAELLQPRNMEVFYGCSRKSDIPQDDRPYWQTYWGQVSLYQEYGGAALYAAVVALSVLAALLMGGWGFKRQALDRGIVALPMEFCLLGAGGVALLFEWTISIMMQTCIGAFKNDLLDAGFLEWSSDLLIAGSNLLVWMAVSLVTMWSILVLWPRTKGGFWAYLKERSLILRMCGGLKKLCRRFYEIMTKADISDSVNKTVLKIVLVNLAILTVLCCMWFFGIVGLIFYSIGLYLLLRNYYGRLKEQYETLLDAAGKMADGKLNMALPQDLGFFNPLKIQILRIQNGFKRAVEEEIKSERMKTELITNVSHDLKTPLTAIITYVDLLKKEDITPKERASYIETLEKKSNRLKVLIEDLFEVSKAESENVVLHLEDVDLVNLLKQVRLEMEDKIEASNLVFRWDLPDEKVICYLDGQKTCRIFENLLGNILKYSMEHSRVYIEIRQEEEYVRVVLKNMSATELNFDPTEITERFVRGDLSRNTEGSGLGLAIVRSFVELQKGSFQIAIDGDLFKAQILWPVKRKDFEMEEEMQEPKGEDEKK